MWRTVIVILIYRRYEPIDPVQVHVALFGTTYHVKESVALSGPTDHVKISVAIFGTTDHVKVFVAISIVISETNRPISAQRSRKTMKINGDSVTTFCMFEHEDRQKGILDETCC